MMDSKKPVRTTWLPLGGDNHDNIGGNCNVIMQEWEDGAGVLSREADIIDVGILFGKRNGKYSGFLPCLDDFLDRIDDKGNVVEPARIPARAIHLTHAHEDHIGGIGHFINRGFRLPPIYCSRLTAQHVRSHLAQFITKESQWPKIIELEPGQMTSIPGIGDVEPVSVSHSISQAFAFHIRTPNARFVFSGDCKIDQSVRIGPKTDLPRLAEIGALGVDAFMIDSTRAQVPGFTTEETVVEKAFSRIMSENPGKRLVVAIMATSSERIAGLAVASAMNGRKVIHEGPKIKECLYALRRAGIDLEDMHPGVRIHIGKSQEAARLSPGQVTEIATGTQGEIFAALPLAARGQHRRLKLDTAKDIIIISASLIPGNETEVQGLVAQLRGQGFTVILAQDDEVYASGHAARKDCEKFTELLNPVCVIPVHGSAEHRRANGAQMQETGRKVVQADNGCEVAFGGPAGAEVVGHRPQAWVGVRENQKGSYAERLAMDPKRRFTYDILPEDASPAPAAKPVSPAPAPKI